MYTGEFKNDRLQVDDDDDDDDGDGDDGDDDDDDDDTIVIATMITIMRFTSQPQEQRWATLQASVNQLEKPLERFEEMRY